MTATTTGKIKNYMTPSDLSDYMTLLVGQLGHWNGADSWVIYPLPDNIRVEVPYEEQMDVVIDAHDWFKQNIIRFSTAKLVRAEKEGDKEYIEFMGLTDDV